MELNNNKKMTEYESRSIPKKLIQEIEKHIEECAFGYRGSTEYIISAARDQLRREKELLNQKTGDTNVKKIISKKN